MKLSPIQKASFEKLAKKYKIKLILLFGSEVTKKRHLMSDLDIGVCFEKNELNFQKFGQLISEFQEIFPKKEIDLAIINNADPLFLKKILETAQLLYGKKSNLAKLKLYSFHQYLDYQKYFKLEEKFCHQFLRQFE
jgi:predicted nucleotidyltransferase